LKSPAKRNLLEDGAGDDADGDARGGQEQDRDPFPVAGDPLSQRARQGLAKEDAAEDHERDDRKEEKRREGGALDDRAEPEPGEEADHDRRKRRPSTSTTGFTIPFTFGGAKRDGRAPRRWRSERRRGERRASP